MTSTYFGIVSVIAAIGQMTADDSAKLKVVDFATGSDSQAVTSLVQLAKTPQEWAQVWQFHRTAPVVATGAIGAAVLPETMDLPVVDFDHTNVLAIFGGITNGVTGYSLSGVGSVKHHAVIRLQPVSGLPNGSLTVATQPYAFIQITRIKSPIDVEMLSGIDSNGAPIWTKIASFNKEEKKSPQPGAGGAPSAPVQNGSDGH
jgi:hypothetical protein